MVMFLELTCRLRPKTSDYVGKCSRPDCSGLVPELVRQGEV